MFKVNNRNTRTRCEICSELKIKIFWHLYSGIFIVNFKHISHLVLVFFCYVWAGKCRLGNDITNMIELYDLDDTDTIKFIKISITGVISFFRNWLQQFNFQPTENPVCGVFCWFGLVKWVMEFMFALFPSTKHILQ